MGKSREYLFSVILIGTAIGVGWTLSLSALPVRMSLLVGLLISPVFWFLVATKSRRFRVVRRLFHVDVVAEIPRAAISLVFIIPVVLMLLLIDIDVSDSSFILIILALGVLFRFVIEPRIETDSIFSKLLNPQDPDSVLRDE